MYKTLIRFFKLFPSQMSIMCFSLLIANVLEGVGLGLMIPVLQKVIGTAESQTRLTQWFDHLFYSLHITPNLLNSLILLCLAYIARGAVTLWARHVSVKIAGDFQLHFKEKTYKKILSSNLHFFWDHRQGELMNTLTTEANRASAAFFSAAQCVSVSMSVVLYFGFAVFISGWLALIAVIVGIITLTPLKVIVRKAKKFGNLTTSLNEKIQNELLEVLGAIKIVKGACNEESAFRRFSKQSKSYRDTWYRIVFNANSITIYAQPIAVILLSIFLYTSLKLNIPVSEIFVFVLVFIRLIPAISGVQGHQHDLNNNLPGYERIDYLLETMDLFKERQDGIKIISFEKAIEFKQVFFEYIKDKPIIRNINFTIPANQTIAFVGPSGAGKSTLVDLILGFYIPQKGHIHVDSLDLQKIELHSWRKQIAYVTQDVILFNDTVKANISWGEVSTGIEVVMNAAKMAAAHEFIVNLEEGYNTIIGDRGVKLSGGQKQRLALARALMQNPKLLILDEATSSLDHHSELLIKHSIKELSYNHKMTIIMIAHRLTTVQEADHIFVLDNGHIAEHGEWKQLTSDKKGYLNQILSQA